MKKILLLLIAIIATTTVWAEDYITDVMVIGGSKSETNALKTSYTNQGWTVISIKEWAVTTARIIFAVINTGFTHLFQSLIND